MTTSQQKLLWQLLGLGFIISIGFAFYYHYTELSPFEPDSHGYIAFAPSRTVGYPLFLKLFHGIFNSFIPILYIQQTLYTISTVCLCMAFYRLTENKKLCFLLFFLLSCNRWMVKYNFLILTESLSFSLVMIILSVMIFYLFSPKKSYLILLSSLVGLAILIRPVFYAFIPVLFLISLYIRSYCSILKSLVSFLIPLVFILNSSSVYNWFQHGFYNTESFLGHNLIGKVGFIVDRSIPSRHPDIIQAFSNVAEPIQELDQQITSSHLRYIIRAPYYDYFRYNRLNDIVNTSTLSPSKADELYKEVAFDIIKAKPFEYLYDVWLNYASLWFVLDFKTIGEKRVLKKFLEDHSPLPGFGVFPFGGYHEVDQVSLLSEVLRFSFAWILRIVLIITYFVSLIISLKTLFIPSSKEFIKSIIISLSSLLIQSVYLLTALIQVGIPRYAMALWPALFVLILLISDIFLRSVTKTR